MLYFHVVAKNIFHILDDHVNNFILQFPNIWLKTVILPTVWEMNISLIPD